MADWGRRVDVVTWCLLGLVTCFWAVSLGGVAALSKIYSGPSNNGKVYNLRPSVALSTLFNWPSNCRKVVVGSILSFNDHISKQISDWISNCTAVSAMSPHKDVGRAAARLYQEDA